MNEVAKDTLDRARRVRLMIFDVDGVLTDGDLRRTIEKRGDFSGLRVDDVMSKNPRTLRPQTLAAEAVHVMEAHKVNQVLVLDERDQLVGALNMHDLFRAKVV